MVTEILGMLTNVLGMVNSMNAQDDYTNTLNDVSKKQAVSPAMLQAQQILRERSQMGLPGYESLKSDIETQLPTTMNEARQWLTGPGMADYISRASAVTNQQLRNLGVMDAQTQDKNIQDYASFLSGPLATAQKGVSDSQSALNIIAANSQREKQNDTNDFLSAIAGQAGELGDQDWRQIIALLAGNKNKSGDVFNTLSPYLDSIPNTTPSWISTT